VILISFIFLIKKISQGIHREVHRRSRDFVYNFASRRIHNRNTWFLSIEKDLIRNDWTLKRAAAIKGWSANPVRDDVAGINNSYIQTPEPLVQKEEGILYPGHSSAVRKLLPLSVCRVVLSLLPLPLNCVCL